MRDHNLNSVTNVTPKMLEDFRPDRTNQIHYVPIFGGGSKHLCAVQAKRLHLIRSNLDFLNALILLHFPNLVQPSI